MADIVIVYDRSETDEMGIKLTADDMGIQLSYLPFHKVAVGFWNGGFSYESLGKDYIGILEDAKVILNRTQSKARRIYASAMFETLEKEVINPPSIEMMCNSKFRTLLAFYKNNVKIPKTIYFPCNSKEAIAGGALMDNSEFVSELVTKKLGVSKIVLKPDAGTHGCGVCLAENREHLKKFVSGITPSVINPAGIVAQELIPKWFYDLRIIVEKEKGKPGFCYPQALVRGGFKEFRTNTFLGNMVFRAELPETVRSEAVRCGEIIGEGTKAWVIALDAMPNIGEKNQSNSQKLKQCFDDLVQPFNKVKRVKQRANKKRDFETYSKEIKKVYEDYMATDAYAYIKETIHESLLETQERVVFHEGNACPEFWEQTRIVGGVNVAESLLKVANSLLD